MLIRLVIDQLRIVSKLTSSGMLPLQGLSCGILRPTDFRNCRCNLCKQAEAIDHREPCSPHSLNLL